jgi:tetratricopeptide (TPR) repeat protein
MKRLLTIGGLLIGLSLALGILLRVLLVPSGDAPAEPEKKTAEQKTSETTATEAASAAPSTSTTAPINVSAPTTAEEHFEQALSFLDTGRLKEARAAFQKALEIDPDNPRAKTRLSLLEEEISQKADRHFGNARQAFQYLRYEEAIGEWEIFLTLADPSDVRYAEAQQGIQQAKAKLR